MKNYFLDKLGEEDYTHTFVFFPNDPKMLGVYYNHQENKIYFSLCVTYRPFRSISKKGIKKLEVILSKQKFFEEYLDNDNSLTVVGIYPLKDVNKVFLDQLENFLNDSELINFCNNIDEYCESLISKKIDYFVEMFQDQVDEETLLNYLSEIKDIANEMDKDYKK